MLADFVAYIPPMDHQTLDLLLAGLVGSFLHAAVTINRDTFTRATLVETIIGGLGGPLLQNIEMFNDATPWAQIFITFISTYAAPDFAINFAKQAAQRFPSMLKMFSGNSKP